jgi:tetratricopeptide (TPR) repeat protein
MFAATFVISVVAGVLALPIIWRERRLFRLLPTIAFSYVGFQAIRNGNHFALVVGTVASWNLGSLNWKQRPQWRAATLTTLVVGGLFYAVVSEHWHMFAAPTRMIGTSERQFQYPHEAMRKAGLPGTPNRALVMHNGHAALYEYKNYTPANPKKTFADARLEVHTLRTYKEYLDLCTALRKPDGPGESTLRAEKIDLVSADGDQYSEVQASFFCNPNWVCVHYDEMAALFLRADQPLPAGLQKWDPKEELFRNPTPLVDLPLEIPREPGWWFMPPAEVRKGRDDVLTVRAGYVWEKMASGNFGTPENIRVWNMLSLQAARRAAARRPWKADSYRALGYAALASARPGVTFATATELPDIVPIATAMFNFKRTLQIDSNDFYARMWLGQTYMGLGEFDLAEREFTRLKSAWPRDRQQVKVLAPGGQLEQSIDDLKRKRESRTTPDNGVAQRLAPDGVVENSEEAGRKMLLVDAGRAFFVFNQIDLGNKHVLYSRLFEAAAQACIGMPVRSLATLDRFEIQSAQADWLRAWLAIQAGDRETAAKAIAAGKSRNPTPTTQRALEHLELLVK